MSVQPTACLQDFLPKACGLSPSVWLCVGNGFSREEIKALALRQGRGFVGQAVLGLEDLCTRVLGLSATPVASAGRILGPLARQEVLRRLISDPKIQFLLDKRFTHLKLLKRQRDFYRRLDLALQTGRMAFAHAAEEEVFNERLAQLLGENPLRLEMSLFAKAYEAWLEATGVFDPPLLVRKAAEALEEHRVVCKLPQEIVRLSLQTPESLENRLWEAIGAYSNVVHIQSALDRETLNLGSKSSDAPLEQNGHPVVWQVWHTLDDAAEGLADELLLRGSPSDWRDDAVLIPDDPSVRRSLGRALKARQIPMAEPRDPTELLWDEAIKWALAPLEVVARNYERTAVISYIGQVRRSNAPDKIASQQQWIPTINQLGIRSGLRSYQDSPLLSGLWDELLELRNIFGKKLSCEQIAALHLEWISKNYVEKTPGRNPNHLSKTFKALWQSLGEDLGSVGWATRKAPSYFWMEKIQARIRESGPLVDGLKPRYGIQIYRLQQAPTARPKRVWILGIPSDWLAGEGSGSYWYTPWEREILSAEFAVQSGARVAEARREVLRSWILPSMKTVFLDANYSEQGRERESLDPLFQELSLVPKFEDKGAHSRFERSYRKDLVVQPQEVLLSPIPVPEDRTDSPIVLSATLLDRYSRCAFQALTFHRWKLRDLREPELELWPDVKGNILHACVRILQERHLQTGKFDPDLQNVLSKVWGSGPKGLIQSKRLVKHIKYKLGKILEAFCEREQEYLEISGARPIFLDQQKIFLTLDAAAFPGYASVVITGQPDRVDRVDSAHWESEEKGEVFLDGLFVVDYKASGALPHGELMMERGYRLQLPIYAIALQKMMNTPVLGVQFVELNRKNTRASGIFFKALNGKDPGKLTQARSSSKSLCEVEPALIWERLEAKVVQASRAYLNGVHSALPNIEPRQKECQRCGAQDLCGYRRLVVASAEEEMQ